MLTAVERVLILKSADLLKDAGPRHLLALANVAREVEIFQGDLIYDEVDPADALYIVVHGRVRLTTGDRVVSEVGPGEAFGTWSLVDDSARGHKAVCIEDGLTLALQRDDFYDLAAADLTLLQELVRVLAKRLRALAERPEEARVEGEGIEKPESVVESEENKLDGEPAPPLQAGAALSAAALGKPASETPREDPMPEPTVTPDEVISPEPTERPPERPKP